MKFGKVFVVLALAILLVLALQPVSAQVYTNASTSGFGAAFGYAQTIGDVAYVQTGGIGTADAGAWATTPYSMADSTIWTTGNAAGFSAAIGSPFGSQAMVQLASFIDGMAMGTASASP